MRRLRRNSQTARFMAATNVSPLPWQRIIARRCTAWVTASARTNASVETHLWWKGGWQFQWHRVVAYQPAIFRLGTYSLPLKDATHRELAITTGFGHATTDELGVAIQPLLGFQQIKAHQSDPERRTHILAWHSLLLAGETEKIVGEQHLMALVWAGRIDEERAPWKVQSSSEGKLTLRHPSLGEWHLAHADLPPLSPTSQST